MAPDKASAIITWPYATSDINTKARSSTVLVQLHHAIVLHGNQAQRGSKRSNKRSTNLSTLPLLPHQWMSAPPLSNAQGLITCRSQSKYGACHRVY